MLAGVFNRGCPPQERSFHAAGPEVVLADASNEHLRPIAGIKRTINPKEIRGLVGY
jgi:hypothetical protein